MSEMVACKIAVKGGDSRNAISFAATWPAGAEGITNPKFIHSWDECCVLLNAFDEKQDLLCTEEGREISKRRISFQQGQRRMFKILRTQQSPSKTHHDLGL
jgi:hypothetical protein